MSGLGRPDIVVPPGACDAHAHIIGPPPYAPTCTYVPAEAPLVSYLQMLDKLGLERGVIVQPEAHGTDNRLLVETLKKNSKRLRGVAVVSPDVSDVELRESARAGVCGLRVGTTISLSALESLAARSASHDLHLQIYARAADLPALKPRLERLGVPIIIDHMAYPLPERGVIDRSFQILLELVGQGTCWVKLSGAYRWSKAGFPFHDTTPFARELIAVAPNRVVWGSDWPHVAMGRAAPNTASLLKLLSEWAPNDVVRHSILVDNPARLYKF